eukprot:TRINITY_DN12631_c3_g1_i1.p1 TRINITY_DN12631_c3_g1~~TRINITY_DN12631_c3_g1_i1.p1  ORF type:complete len:134 (+),score=9.09 TRINITY_DN12631_c3_g1_i1:32-403(+)
MAALAETLYTETFTLIFSWPSPTPLPLSFLFFLPQETALSPLFHVFHTNPSTLPSLLSQSLQPEKSQSPSPSILRETLTSPLMKTKMVKAFDLFPTYLFWLNQFSMGFLKTQLSSECTECKLP